MLKSRWVYIDERSKGLVKEKSKTESNYRLNMPSAPNPSNEADRQKALDRYNIIDSLPEEAFDDITTLAAYICETPIALISLVDRDRQWFKSKYGLDADETPREQAFCAHAILEPKDIFVVSDASIDKRFADNPLVTVDPQIRFYAGAPLVTPDGYAVGTVCAIDRKPRQLNSEQLRALRALSRQTIAQMELRRNVQQLSETLRRLQHTQASLIHTEKMSALGQFVAGIAHEINNPISFIAGNLPHAHGYSAELIRAIELYRQVYPNPPETILEEIEAIDLDYLAEDFPKLLDSMKFGADRIQKIVESLRMFSHLDEAEIKTVDLHQQLENTLNIAGQRFQATETRGEIRLIRDFGDLPPVTCAVGQLNQVFLNLIANAIDAIDARSNYLEIPEINIKTEYFQGKNTRIRIQISDNGIGISEELSSKIFEPFFTTKSVGQGTGIGLSTSYQIVTKTHGGQLYFKSKVDIGTSFVVEIPVSIDSSK